MSNAKSIVKITQQTSSIWNTPYVAHLEHTMDRSRNITITTDIHSYETCSSPAGQDAIYQLKSDLPFGSSLMHTKSNAL